MKINWNKIIIILILKEINVIRADVKAFKNLFRTNFINIKEK